MNPARLCQLGKFDVTWPNMATEFPVSPTQSEALLAPGSSSEAMDMTPKDTPSTTLVEGNGRGLQAQ